MNHDHAYRNLGLMLFLSFVTMYVLMYAMVNTFSNVLPNYNQFYMAGLMASPMALIELWLMRSMYRDKKKNLLIIALSLVLIALFWLGVRQQRAINDEQFLRSMIPHHAGAILMCEKAQIEDTEIRELCRGIVEGQQTEIELMKSKLEELKTR